MILTSLNAAPPEVGHACEDLLFSINSTALVHAMFTWQGRVSSTQTRLNANFFYTPPPDLPRTGLWNRIGTRVQYTVSHSDPLFRVADLYLVIAMPDMLPYDPAGASAAHFTVKVDRLDRTKTQLYAQDTVSAGGVKWHAMCLQSETLGLNLTVETTTRGGQARFVVSRSAPEASTAAETWRATSWKGEGLWEALPPHPGADPGPDRELITPMDMAVPPIGPAPEPPEALPPIGPAPGLSPHCNGRRWSLAQ